MVNETKNLLNGQPADLISLKDRGLLFGDGVFETMACVDGHVQFLDAHLARLERGASVLGIPGVDRELWQEDLALLIEPDGRQVIKLLLTRGVGGFGYASPESPNPTRIAMSLPWPMEPPNDSFKIGLLNARLGSNRQLSGLKHLNRLEQVLAAQELSARNLHEGLLLSQQGFVVEGVSANVFFAFKNRLITPPLDCSGVNGVARDVLLASAKAGGVDINIDYVEPAAALSADEIILTNSVRGVRLVTHIDGQSRSSASTWASSQMLQWWEHALRVDRDTKGDAYQ